MKAIRSPPRPRRPRSGRRRDRIPRSGRPPPRRPRSRERAGSRTRALVPAVVGDHHLEGGRAGTADGRAPRRRQPAGPGGRAWAPPPRAAGGALSRRQGAQRDQPRMRSRSRFSSISQSSARPLSERGHEPRHLARGLNHEAGDQRRQRGGRLAARPGSPRPGEDAAHSNRDYQRPRREVERPAPAGPSPRAKPGERTAGGEALSRPHREGVHLEVVSDARPARDGAARPRSRRLWWSRNSPSMRSSSSSP